MGHHASKVRFLDKRVPSLAFAQTVAVTMVLMFAAFHLIASLMR